MKKMVVLAFLIATASVQAQQPQVFLDIPTIPGESQFEDFVDTIDVASWSQTVANVGGPPVVMPLRFQHRIDLATPRLIEAALLNTNLGDVVLSVVRTNGEFTQTYIEITLSDTRVAAVEATSVIDDVPSEQVTLTCSTFMLSYRAQNNAGGLEDPVIAQGSCQ
jgi:type VI protein secretion system component Hcp